MTDEIISLDSPDQVAVPNDNWAIRRYSLYNDGSGLFNIPITGSVTVDVPLKWEMDTYPDPPYTVDPFGIFGLDDNNYIRVSACGFYIYRMRLIWDDTLYSPDPTYPNVNALALTSVYVRFRPTGAITPFQGANLILDWQLDDINWVAGADTGSDSIAEDLSKTVDFEWFNWLALNSIMADQGGGVLSFAVHQHDQNPQGIGSTARNLICNTVRGAKMGTWIDVAYWGSMRTNPVTV